MKKTLIKAVLLGAVLSTGALTSCDSDSKNNPNPDTEEPNGREFITLTASIPDASGTAGNGGTMAYAITHEQAINPSFTLDMFKGDGFGLRSARTARVQGSDDGTELYNIQYTGDDGGVFNKYQVKGQKNFVDTNQEFDLSDILGTSPRWNKAAEGIGVGVHLSGSTTVYEGTTNPVFKYTRGTVKIADIDLVKARVPNSTEFPFPFSAELEAQGYSVGRIDVPVLNHDKSKIYIGCNVTKVDPTKAPTFSAAGVPSWPTDNNNREIGTVTLVVDYPTLANPKLIFSGVSKVNNHAYRTTTQYVGTDGHVYQATATSGQDILRISKSTNDYDNSYHFSLDQALGLTGTRIRAWRYVKDGVAVILYDTGNNSGGYIALADLNAKTATKLTTEVETEATLTTTLGQYQNIAVSGDYVYVPLTPAGSAGNLYVINWKTKQITKGAQLAGQSGSFYLGSY